MKEIQAKGICIKCVDYGESDKLITLYLEGTGKILCRAKGIRKPKAKLRFAAMPMTEADLSVIENNGYYLLKSADIISAHKSIFTDIEAVYMANVMLELFDKFALEGDVVDNYFNTVCDFLSALEKNRSFSTLNKYLLEFLKFAGFEVRTEISGVFDGGKLYYDSLGEGFNTAGKGVSVDEGTYKGTVMSDNFLDTDEESAYKVFKLSVFHIESLAEVRLRSAVGLRELIEK